MPTIEFNNFWMQGFGQRVFRVDDLDPSTSLSTIGFLPRTNAGGGGAIGRFSIMKGVIPSNFSGFTTYNASGRSADALIIVEQPAVGAAINFCSATNPCIISSAGFTAANSGTATWFWITSTTNSAYSFNPNGTILQQAIGTVGLRGSGADLEISDTNIVSGQTYRINSLKINFPSVYTY